LLRNDYIYPGVSGPEGIGKSTIAVTTTMDPKNFFVTTNIKAYSAVGTPVATNWQWFEPYADTYLPTNIVTGAIAYNAADGLYYSWGSANNSINSQQVPTLDKVLLRNAPANISQAMTPLPATILNSLVTTLNTKVKESTDKYCTLIVAKPGPYPSNSKPYLNFITTDNKVVRYRLDNGAYTVLSLPSGVNPLSIVLDYYGVGPTYSNDGIYILGSNGKIYFTLIYPSTAGETATVSTYANTIWSNTVFPFVTQITYAVNNNLAFLADGKIGALFLQASPATYMYPLSWQSGNIDQLLSVQTVDGSTSIGSSTSFAHVKTQTGLFRTYDAKPRYFVTKNSYGVTALDNYFNQSSFSINMATYGFIKYFDFYPSKCISY
jgi:hypothetical protein